VGATCWIKGKPFRRYVLVHVNGRNGREREREWNLIYGNEHIAVFYFHFVHLNRFDGGQAERPAGPHIEAGAVPRAFYLIAIQVAVGQWKISV
jgi:hypothetical protein